MIPQTQIWNKAQLVKVLLDTEFHLFVCYPLSAHDTWPIKQPTGRVTRSYFFVSSWSPSFLFLLNEKCLDHATRSTHEHVNFADVLQHILTWENFKDPYRYPQKKYIISNSDQLNRQVWVFHDVLSNLIQLYPCRSFRVSRLWLKYMMSNIVG